MVSRKKAAGKARKAAKAKARQAAEEEGNNNQVNEELKQSLAVAVTAQASPYLTAPEPALQPTSCQHSVHPLYEGVPYQFVKVFTESYYEAAGDGGRPLAVRLLDATNATKAEFADVWNDSAMMKMAISELLGSGTRVFLEGNYDGARDCATLVRYLEQYTAVELEQKRAVCNWPKINEVHHADLHTLVKYFRHRIPCSCLDEKYEEVKSITKMGLCYNEKCKFPNRMTERSNTMCCSRCRCAVYCSRECQIADFSRHRPFCDKNSEIQAEFEAKQKERNL